MSKSGFYAVKVGRNPGVYYNKQDYMEQIEGFPYAEGRRFTNEMQAWEYIYQDGDANKGEEIFAERPRQKKKGKQGGGRQPPPGGRGGWGRDRGWDRLGDRGGYGRFGRDYPPYPPYPSYGRGRFPDDEDDDNMIAAYQNAKNFGEPCPCEIHNCDMGRALVISEMRSIKTGLKKQMTILQENMKVLANRVEDILGEEDGTIEESLLKMTKKKAKKEKPQAESENKGEGGQGNEQSPNGVEATDNTQQESEMAVDAEQTV